MRANCFFHQEQLGIFNFMVFTLNRFFFSFSFIHYFYQTYILIIFKSHTLHNERETFSLLRLFVSQFFNLFLFYFVYMECSVFFSFFYISTIKKNYLIYCMISGRDALKLVEECILITKMKNV